MSSEASKSTLRVDLCCHKFKALQALTCKAVFLHWQVGRIQIPNQFNLYTVNPGASDELPNKRSRSF